MKTINVFFSYSHKDESFREELEKHLSILRRNKKISEWHDRKITPGSDWSQEINENMESAQIILMLISPDFVASDYCFEIESMRALQKHALKEAIVIPVIIRPCVWTETPFAKIQALPKNGTPVSTFANADEAWVDVTKGILKVVNQLLDARKDAEPNGTVTEDAPAPPVKEQVLEDQLIQLLSEHREYWFSPAKMKTIAETVVSMRELSLLNIAVITCCCEGLTQKGMLEETLNVKGNKIYRINPTISTKIKEKWKSLSPT